MTTYPSKKSIICFLLAVALSSLCAGTIAIRSTALSSPKFTILNTEEPAASYTYEINSCTNSAYFARETRRRILLRDLLPENITASVISITNATDFTFARRYFPSTHEPPGNRFPLPSAPCRLPAPSPDFLCSDGVWTSLTPVSVETIVPAVSLLTDHFPFQLQRRFLVYRRRFSFPDVYKSMVPSLSS